MNYIEQNMQQEDLHSDISSKILKFEASMGQLAEKIHKPALRVRNVKAGMEKMKWPLIGAIAFGSITYLYYKFYRN